MKIAKRGEVGFAIKDVRPHDKKNLGRVATLFGNKHKPYWVKPSHLQFNGGENPADYVQREEKPEQVKLPTYSGDLSFSFGHNIKLWRKARNMSQLQISKLMSGIGHKTPQSVISYIESNNVVPDEEKVKALALVLSIHPSVLFMNIEDKPTLKDIAKFMALVRRAD
jgi:ribosome-binding protein aMBF1 (putative translation factor)